VPALWYSILTAADNILEKRLDRAWAAQLGPRIPISQRFPRTPANASARGVDQFADKVLGADFGRVRNAVIAYLRAQNSRGDDVVEERPADIEHFVIAHRSDIDGLEHFVETNDPPQWEVDLDALERPRSLQYYTLQRLVLLDALESARTNDFAAARRYIELAYRLTASLRTRPDVLAVITAIAELPGDAIQLPRFDARERIIDAREAEAWTMLRAVETSSFDRNRNNAAFDILVRPYARLCAIARSSDELRNSLVTRNFDRCVFQPPKTSDDTSLMPSPINSDSATHAATLAVRANRIAIDFEGSERIAALKGSPAPGAFVSLCLNHKWIFDGHLLHLEPSLPASPGSLPPRHAITAAQTPSQQTSTATARAAPASK
ncbi:MAG: hypothetical protein DMF59_11995, partial [Acidobacteria bacterium]